MRKILFLALVVILLTAVGVSAHGEGDTTLIPIGGFYVDTFPGFVEAALHHAEGFDSGRVYMLMMPMSFTYNPLGQTEEELIDNEIFAERRRRQLEDECRLQAPEDVSCEVVVPPIYTREAALTEIALDYFADDLAAVYFLGGDQTFAMQITAGTPLEAALQAAFESGVPMGGNSAGLAILSRTMIGGYGGDEFGPENALREGAVDLWNGEDGMVGEETVPRRGLDFGAQSVVLEQHFWERARFARLLNAVVQPDVPHVGIGVDSLTGGLLENDQTFGSMFGIYGGAVIDAQSLGAVETASFESGVLSVRNVLVHVLAPGDFSYDTVERQPSWVNATGVLNRDWSSAFATPEGAGMLVLMSNLTAHIADVTEQINSMPTAVIVTAYADPDAVAALYADTSAEVFVLGAGDALPDLTGYELVIVHAGDQSLIDVAQLEPLRAFHETSGTTLVMDDAAAAVAGAYYSAHAPTPYDSDDDLLIEEATQASFMVGATTINAGLGLVNVTVEPSVMDDNRYGRFFSLAYQHPELLALAINDDVSLVISNGSAFIPSISTNGVITLDLSGAALSWGDNGYMTIGNGVLDVFAPDEALVPSNE